MSGSASSFSTSLEVKLAERLRGIADFRTKQLARILPPWLENNALFHAILFTTTLFLMIAVFVELRALKLFAFHPICMCVGTFIFLGEGIASYRNKSIVETFAPIMQHNKRVKTRVVHQTLQITGAAFILLGLLFQLANKIVEKKTIVPHTLHSIIGSLVIIVIGVQCVSGAQKMQQQGEGKGAVKTRRWHGDNGLLLWDLLCLTILLGSLEFFQWTFTNLLVELSIVGAWLAVHAQMRRRGDFSDERERDVEALSPSGAETEPLAETL